MMHQHLSFKFLLFVGLNDSKRSNTNKRTKEIILDALKIFEIIFKLEGLENHFFGTIPEDRCSGALVLVEF